MPHEQLTTEQAEALRAALAAGAKVAKGAAELSRLRPPLVIGTYAEHVLNGDYADD